MLLEKEHSFLKDKGKQHILAMNDSLLYICVVMPYFTSVLNSKSHTKNKCKAI